TFSMRFEPVDIDDHIQRHIERNAIPFERELTPGVGIRKAERLASFRLEANLRYRAIDSMWPGNDPSTDTQGLILFRKRRRRDGWLPRLRLRRRLRCGRLATLGRLFALRVERTR